MALPSAELDPVGAIVRASVSEVWRVQVKDSAASVVAFEQVECLRALKVHMTQAGGCAFEPVGQLGNECGGRHVTKRRCPRSTRGDCDRLRRC